MTILIPFRLPVIFGQEPRYYPRQDSTLESSGCDEAVDTKCFLISFDLLGISWEVKAYTGFKPGCYTPV